MTNPLPATNHALPTATVCRRSLIKALAAACAAAAVPAWAQSPKINLPTVLQVVDTSPEQVDVSKDFLVGARAAWQDFNAKGGLRGKAIKHLVIEVDGSDGALRAAIDTAKKMPDCIAAVGTVGDRTATRMSAALRKEIPDLPHAAPWLQNSAIEAGDNTFAIFASRQEQIAHAIRSLSVMGVTEFAAVYGSYGDYAAYHADVAQAATALKLRLKTYESSTNLLQMGRSLTPDTPRVIIFIGGTPELFQFAQGIEKQAAQRYIVAMSDVNVQTLGQLGISRFTPVIATQVVPLINSNLPVVRAYRETLGRLYDEPPTSQSLAGFISARYAQEILLSADGAISRATSMQAFAQRSPIDVGGFRITADIRRRGNSYVTQSMIGADGKIIG